LGSLNVAANKIFKKILPRAILICTVQNFGPTDHIKTFSMTLETKCFNAILVNPKKNSTTLSKMNGKI